MPITVVSRASLIDASRRIEIKEESWKLSSIADNFNRDGAPFPQSINIPPGQRLWAWKNETGRQKKVKLIDSLMHNYPVPSSILNWVNGSYEVYDGRHRMETIWRFVNNEFAWNEVFYRDLCESDRFKFDSREIPVTITYAKKGQAVTTDQLANIFIRLNSGQRLTDSDMFWAYRDTPLMKGVRTLILDNARLKAVFGGIDMNNRRDLANWVAYYCGLATNNAGNMTTSYIRVHNDVGLDDACDTEAVRNGIDALCSLYERAKTDFSAEPKELRSYKKIGFMNAFFLAEWMAATDKAAVITKWHGIIGRLRGNTDSQRRMRFALITTGAQNLTIKKVQTVLEQVKEYLEAGRVEERSDSDDDSV